ncbi:unnamed protein product [Oppiella nova]|uniref:RNA helicase n=1 Tax=Oppiella nova TaxID=334625 RepID=A0A7R9ME81_9ACAR|nr:unnamed protein product [Oppiella nova]CAG2174775.1 unnamed protein product [Oppiella nova]
MNTTSSPVTPTHAVINGTDLLEDRHEEQLRSDEKICLAFNQHNKHVSSDEHRKRLPVNRFRDEIEYLMTKYQTLVIVGETGCGKSTQLPQIVAQICHQWMGTDTTTATTTPTTDHKHPMVAITEPRRVAAVSLAARVAQEMSVELGREVGYAIGFEDCVDRQRTRIKFVTEGILVNELMSDPLVTSYGAIIVDEAHERTLNTDILLALLKKILRKRPALRLVVSSATIECQLMKEYFNFNASSDRSADTSTVLCLDGRCHPVDVYYSRAPVADYVKESVQTVIKIHERYQFGDILVFLTGMEEVDACVSTLKDYARSLREKQTPGLRKLYVLPMYASLPATDQMRVFDTFGKSVRKVIVATNIAEISLTIPGVSFIVDSGFVKMRFYNPRTCTDSLVVVPTSQASAQQRAGRAGRERAGNAFRLYTEQAFQELTPFTTPEIQRSCLALTILQLKALGVNNIAKFEFISPPPERHVVSALDLLYALGAIGDTGALTQPLGLQMAEFPLHPMFAKMLLSSPGFGCSVEALTICAVLQVHNIWQQPGGGQRALQARRAKHELSVEEGDLIAYLNVYNLFVKADKVRSWADRHYLNYKALVRAVEVRHRLESVMNRFRMRWRSAGDDVDAVRRCIVAGFFANAAYLDPSGNYRTVRGDHELHIHPQSVLYTRPRPPKWVVFHEVLHTSQQFMRDVTPIDPKWLTELAPHYYQCGTDREIMESKLTNNT